LIFFQLFENVVGWAWWYLPVFPALQEVDMGGSRFEASPGKKVSKKDYLKKQVECDDSSL
jgi:hypothetical protein